MAMQNKGVRQSKAALDFIFLPHDHQKTFPSSRKALHSTVWRSSETL